MSDNGGLVGRINFTTASTAPGVWSEDDQYNAQKSSLWPTPASIITANLRLNLDASNSSSYSGSGTTWTDLTGNTNATLVNSPTFNSSGVKSFTFNGTTQYATIPYASSPFRQTSAITYEAWVNVDSGGGGYVAGTSVSGGQGTGGFSIYDNNMYFTWTPTSPGSDRLFNNTTGVSFVTKWRHICMTFDYTNNVKAMYIDGVSVAMTDSASWTNAVPVTGYNLNQVDSVGGRYVNSQAYFKGKIAELRIYNAALTATQVLNNFNATRGKYPPSTVEYLVVAGGGGSGGSYGLPGYYGLGGGGGGAGGYRTATGFEVSAATSHIVTVGAGGVAGSTSQTDYRGGVGGNSVFSSITSNGGGGGGCAAMGSRAPQTGSAGGSGGAGSANISPSNGLGGAGTAGQGNNGGDGGTTGFSSGGGGGGATSIGGNGSSTNTTGGAGGTGGTSSINGTSTTYSTGGTGGRSGGSEGAGTANTGNGATAKNIPTNSFDTTAFAGGSGIVIIRYSNGYADPTSTTGSPTVSNTGGYKIYQWTGNGSITF